MCAQSCPTLCDPTDCSPPGSSVREISQARMLEWVDNSFSRGSSHSRDRTCISCLTGGFFITEPPGKSCFLNYYSSKWGAAGSVGSQPIAVPAAHQSPQPPTHDQGTYYPTASPFQPFVSHIYVMLQAPVSYFWIKL